MDRSDLPAGADASAQAIVRSTTEMPHRRAVIGNYFMGAFHSGGNRPVSVIYGIKLAQAHGELTL